MEEITYVHQVAKEKDEPPPNLIEWDMEVNKNGFLIIRAIKEGICLPVAHVTPEGLFVVDEDGMLERLGMKAVVYGGRRFPHRYHEDDSDNGCTG